MNDILDTPEVRQELHPISLEMYHALRDMGLLETNVELIDGNILRKMAKSPLHTLICQRFIEWLREVTIGKKMIIRQEQPLTLENSEPEPDIALVAGELEDFCEDHPRTASLVVEVAITSLKIDQEKIPLYAAAGISEYWLVTPETKTVHIFSNPKNGHYQNEVELGETDSVTCATLGDVKVNLARLIG